ncbi:MauE/DoxX family redox-associated membrane protein [Bacillus manliponensis]|uniref:MauE/DoxX family redox-associated membrane protein n=1 Tax=Bacillus manliponensis TaxID=574376 RepID=UPI0035182861
MDIFFILISFVLGLLFLIGLVEKIWMFKEHISIVESYNIIPKHVIIPFVITTILIEVYLSFCLLFLYFKLPTVILGTFLLCIYTIGISINLIRKNTNISCGCGGVFNHKGLSISLVWRNITLTILLWTIYYLKTIWEISSYSLTILTFLFIIAVNIILLIFIIRYNIKILKIHLTR